MLKPDSSEYNSYYHHYIEQVPQMELDQLFFVEFDNTINWLKQITEEKWTYRYADGKWSVLEVIQHIIDVERIFQNRVHRISREPDIKIQGFDHDYYVECIVGAKCNPQEVVEEWIALRNSTFYLFKNMKDSWYANIGIANGYDISVRALAYIIIGHQLHHIKVLHEKYFDR